MKKQSSFSLAGATKLSLSFSRSKKAAAAASAAASSVDTGLAASVSHENRPTVSTIDPIDMQVGDLALQFRDGGWTSTDTAGNARTLTVPPGRPSSADAAEMERVKKENEALREKNQSLFDKFIDFETPLAAAVFGCALPKARSAEPSFAASRPVAAQHV